MRIQNLLALILTTCLSVPAALAQLPVPDQSRVLFIGNSLYGSVSGGVPEFTNQALQEMGYSGIQHGMIGNWGESLNWGLNNASKYNTILSGGTQQGGSYDLSTQFANTLDAVLGGLDGDPSTTGDQWDYVILQGFLEDDDNDNFIDATEPNGVRGEFFDAVVQLYNAATTVGAETVLYMRWPNNPESFGISFYDSQLATLQSNYDTLAAHLGGLEVVPVAQITHDLLFTNAPDTSMLSAEFDRYNFMYGGDSIHASDYGRGLFGYAVAAMLARQTPVGVSYENGSYSGVPSSIDNAIQSSVWRVIAQRETWADPDAAVIRILSDTDSVEVPEGGTAHVTVSLNANPGTTPVNVSISLSSGDSDLSIQSGVSLFFDTSNWNIPQTVTFAAAEDADAISGQATFALEASGAINHSITVSEKENDLPPGIGVIWAEADGVVRVEAETYYTRSEATHSPQSKRWETQVDGASENSDLSGAAGGQYLAVLPDSYTLNSTRPGDGTLLLDVNATIDYRVHIETPGVYRLYPRAAGPDNGGDTFYAGIVEIRDGDGGVNGGNPEASDDIIADWYRYFAPNNATFNWIGMAEYESDDSSGAANEPTWNINQPGTYTIRFSFREDGVALDAFVLQLDSLTAPTGNGPAASPEYTSAPATLASWVTDNSLIGSDALFDADTDGDSLVQGVEYLLNSDPNTGNRFTQWIAVPTEGSVVFSYISQRASAPNDLTVTLRGSFDLGVSDTWDSIPYNVLTTDNGDGTWTHNYTPISDPTSGEDAYFLRLQVVQQ